MRHPRNPDKKSKNNGCPVHVPPPAVMRMSLSERGQKLDHDGIVAFIWLCHPARVGAVQLDRVRVHTVTAALGGIHSYHRRLSNGKSRC